MFTDTHCHLFSEYYDDINGVVENAIRNSITKIINNGCDIKTNKEILKLNIPNVYKAIGFHPEHVNDINYDDLLIIEENIDNIVAIGEIGLDYHYDKSNKDAQINLFKKQLDIAKKYNIPVVIHSRNATDDTIRILKEYSGLRGVVHCFSGSIETAREYIKLGYYIGVGGVITFKNSMLSEVIKEVPLDRILLETDAPYLTPEPYRGKKNEPARIYDIAKYIANLYNISIEELSKVTEENVNRLFDI